MEKIFHLTYYPIVSLNRTRGPMDRLTKEQRHRNMQAIRSSGTEIELMLAKALWHKGYRYRKNCKNIIGKPDIVFRKYKIAVFCDSEFWHGKDFKKTVKRIGTNKEFWKNKILRNRARDREVTAQLKRNGWRVLRFWETEIKRNLPTCVNEIEQNIEEVIFQQKISDIQM